MSMNLSVTGSLLAVLLTAASMIGCGNSERNRMSASGAAEPSRAAAEGFSDAGPGAGLTAPSSAAAPATAEEGATTGSSTVLFIGTSLTAGLGLPEEQSFPSLIERRIDEAGLPFNVVNAGISGETSSGALARMDWLLRQPFDVAVLETGANDMLRGIDPSVTEQNIQSMIERIREARPDARIVLAGMLALPNLGAAYARDFEAIYPRLAMRNELPLIPFLLEGVAGDRTLNQGDGVHPTAAGQRIVAETVWEVLEPVLDEAAAEP